MTIYTFGYSRSRTLDGLLAALREAGETANTTPVLLDVRRSRGSWNSFWRLDRFPDKHPSDWPERDTIARFHGVRYVWLPELGNQSDKLPWAKAEGWENAVERIVNALPGCGGDTQYAGPWVLVCCEKDPAKCHRTEVAAEIAREVERRMGTPLEVRHLP